MNLDYFTEEELSNPELIERLSKSLMYGHEQRRCLIELLLYKFKVKIKEMFNCLKS